MPGEAAAFDGGPGAPLSLRARSHLDLIRGGAALLVLVHHARPIFIADPPAGASLPLRLAYRASSLGHVAVLAFFVLSGFLVTSSTRARPGWGRYAAARASRVLTVFWPALLLGAALDLVGHHLLHGAIYRGAHPVAWLARVAETVTPSVLLKNVLFLQTIRAPILGSNAPLWTLAYEAWFYVAFPLVALLASASARRRLFALLALLACAWFVGPYVAAAFAVWLLGAAYATVRGGARGEGVALLLVAAIVTAYGWFAVEARDRGDVVRDLAYGVALTFLVAAAATARGEASRAYTSAARALAAISFSLYLVHVPMLVLIAASASVPPRWEPSLAAALRVLLAMVVALLYAIAVWYVVERRTPRVRAMLMRAVTRRA